MATDNIPEGLYPIRAVSRFTGLSPEVIRVWERRYAAVAPSRTGGRARRYTAADIRRFLLLQEATRRGHSIGDVARLPDDVLQCLLDEASVLRGGVLANGSSLFGAQASPGDPYQCLREEYLGAMSRFETRRALALLGTSAAMVPPEDFVLRILVPLLRTVGDRWACSDFSVAHEHAISSQVSGFLTTLLRLAPEPGPGARKILFGTPPGQRHELGTMMAAWLAASRGFDVVYLGPEVPLDNLGLVADAIGASLVVLGILADVQGPEARNLSRALKNLSDVVPIWVGTSAGNPVRKDLRQVRLIDRLEDLPAALDAFKANGVGNVRDTRRGRKPGTGNRAAEHKPPKTKP